MINVTSSSSICGYCGRNIHKENIYYCKHGYPLRTKSEGSKKTYRHNGRIYSHRRKNDLTIEHCKIYHVVKGFTYGKALTLSILFQ